MWVGRDFFLDLNTFFLKFTVGPIFLKIGQVTPTRQLFIFWPYKYGIRTVCLLRSERIQADSLIGDAHCY